MGFSTQIEAERHFEPKTRKNRRILRPKPLPSLGRLKSISDFFKSYPLGGEREALCVQPTTLELIQTLFDCGAMDLTVPDPENEFVQVAKRSIPEHVILRKARGPSIFDLRTSRGFDLWCDPGFMFLQTDEAFQYAYTKELKKRLRFGGYAVLGFDYLEKGSAFSPLEMSATLGLYFELHAIVDAPVSLGKSVRLAIFKRWVGSSGRKR